MASDDEWEIRAVAIAARLDAAADELRRLIDDIRRNRKDQPSDDRTQS